MDGNRLAAAGNCRLGLWLHHHKVAQRSDRQFDSRWRLQPAERIGLQGLLGRALLPQQAHRFAEMSRHVAARVWVHRQWGQVRRGQALQALLV